MDSSFISRAVVKSSGLSTGEKLLLIVLRAYQRSNGLCAPSRAQLRAACGDAADNTLGVWREGLRKKGLIDWKTSPNRCEYIFNPTPPIIGAPYPPNYCVPVQSSR